MFHSEPAHVNEQSRALLFLRDGRASSEKKMEENDRPMESAFGKSTSTASSVVSTSRNLSRISRLASP